jgi:hypothetical protein
MAEMSGAPTVRPSVGAWTGRNQNTIVPVVAALLSLIVFPIVFSALLAHDVRLGGKISLVDAVWLVLALAGCVLILRARNALGKIATGAADRLLASLPDSVGPDRASGASGGTRNLDRDATHRGRVVAQCLLDLAFLLVIQAILRSPLVGLISGVAPEAWVDGSYVVVVVVVAIALLLTVNRMSKPLVERLIWLGLDQVVPTAGFATTSVAATFTAHLATTSSRLATSTRSSRSEPAETRMAPPAQSTASPVVEATVLAPAAFVESTVVAPSEPVDATMLAEPPSNPVGATETIVSEPSTAKPDPNKGKDESA